MQITAELDSSSGDRPISWPHFIRRLDPAEGDAAQTWVEAAAVATAEGGVEVAAPPASPSFNGKGYHSSDGDGPGPLFGLQPLGDDEAPTVKLLQARVRENQSAMLSAFAAHDPAHSGRVSKTDFRSILQTLLFVVVSDAQFEDICRSVNLVDSLDYHVFLGNCGVGDGRPPMLATAAVPKQTVLASRPAVKTSAAAAAAATTSFVDQTWQTVASAITQELQKSMPILVNTLRREDTADSGVLPAGVFRAVLESWFATLSEGQFERLVRAFRLPDSALVSYRAFLHGFDTRDQGNPTAWITRAGPISRPPAPVNKVADVFDRLHAALATDMAEFDRSFAIVDADQDRAISPEQLRSLLLRLVIASSPAF